MRTIVYATDDSVRKGASDVLAAASQGNPTVQAEMEKRKAVSIILKILQETEAELGLGQNRKIYFQIIFINIFQ